MNKCIILALSICSPLHCVEQQIIQREPREWDANLYAKGNKVQYESALHFLQHNNINFDNKHILDVGCGIGDISAYLATNAAHVHGIDASNNMIQYALAMYENYPYNNLSFKQSFIENFSSEQQYDLATALFCFHWITDKQQALQQIARALKQDGELFATIIVSDDPRSQRFNIRAEMVAQLYPQSSLIEKIGRSEISLEELQTILTNTGFEIIANELQTNYVILPDRKAIEDYQRPVLMSRPFIQEMAIAEREAFFTQFIDRIIPTFSLTNDGQFIADVTIRIVHARKIKE